MNILSIICVFFGLIISPNLIISITALNPSSDSTVSLKYAKFLETRQNFKGLNYLVTMTRSSSEIIDQTLSTRFSTPQAKTMAVVDQLKSHSKSSQKNALTLLGRLQGQAKTVQTKEIRFKSMWITNQIVLYEPSDSVILELLRLEEVADIIPEKSFSISPTTIDHDVKDSSPYSDPNVNKNSEQKAYTWNLQKIGVDQLSPEWTTSNETWTGICDTGIYSRHQFFAENTIHPIDVHGSNPPNVEDGHGHGTHVAGVIAQISPRSNLIVCNCLGSDGVGYTSDIMTCWQQLCEMGAGKELVVSNSWGDTEVDFSLHTAVETLRACNVIPVFALGNQGCQQTCYPGNDELVMGVGASTIQDSMAEFSSCGPDSYRCGITPHVVAPGQAIPSAWPTGPTAVVSLSGTSMACPHVSAGVSILRLVCPGASHNTIVGFFTRMATRLDYDKANLCGLGRCDGKGLINIATTVTYALQHKCVLPPPPKWEL